MENESKIKIIAGRLNNGAVRYWKVEKVYCNCGDYVVVENCNGFDLVLIIAEIETTEDFAKKYFTNGYELKNVLHRDYELNEKV